MSCRILLVEDGEIVRTGLQSLFGTRPDLSLAGQTGDGLEAVELAGRLNPDIIIMDVVLPGLKGFEATRQILIADPEAKVLGLSMHIDKRYIKEMLSAGARGYCVKDIDFDELLRAIEIVLAGFFYLSPQVTEAVVQLALQGSMLQPTGAASVLTERERDVLKLLADGYSTKQSAARLEIAPKTIETHRKNMMEKLKVDNIASLVKLAIREGFTRL